MDQRTLTIILTGIFTATLAGKGLADKPVDVVMWSNGFPSGPHFNLNIHGKKDGYICDPTSGGGSVFVPEYGDSQINFVQNKKSSITDLTVHDNCGTFDGDPALVQLPKGEYQVYARILAKPRKDDEQREVIFYPKLVETCNDTLSALDTNGDGVIDLSDLSTMDLDGDGVLDGDINGDGVIDEVDLALYYDFPDAVDCTDSFLLGTGVVTSDGVFDMDSQKLIRNKGRSKAVDVSDLFKWSGYACDQSVDTNGNGEIDLGDAVDINGDGVVDEDELAAYLDTYCTHHDNTWVFDIADLVVYGWDYRNNGSKLVQTRFYPMDTTTFE